MKSLFRNVPLSNDGYFPVVPLSHENDPLGNKALKLAMGSSKLKNYVI